MTINLHKSLVYRIGLDGIELQRFQSIFPYQFNCIEYGLKYLGCFIKLDGYHISYWLWIISKFEKRIHNWCFRWITLSGRATLIKVVLNCIPVFCMTVFDILKIILDKLKKVMFSFLSTGAKALERIHLKIGSLL